MSADTTMTIYGSGHLVGKTARLVICGIDCGTFTVGTQGEVVFTFGTDPGGIITPAYLKAHLSPGTDHDVTFTLFDGTNNVSVTVPVLVGLDYTAQGQLLRPLAEQVMQAGPGAALGKTRRGVFGSVLVRDLFALKLGTSLTNLYPAQLTMDGGLTPELTLAADAPYTGVFLMELDDDIGFDSQLTWQSVGAAPVIIGGAAIYVEGESR